MRQPLIYEIPYRDPQSRFSQIDNINAVWLDSASMSPMSQYSYIAFEPVQVLKLKDGLLNQKTLPDRPEKILQQIIVKHALEKVEGVPPFQGGLAGFFSYDFGWYLEDLPHLAKDDMGFEDFYLGVYDLVISFDHKSNQSWLISTGGLNLNGEQRQLHAQARLEVALRCLDSEPQQTADFNQPINPEIISSTHNPQSYRAMVSKVVDYIYAGDIFEANLTQRFKAPFEGNANVLYHHLREVNPAPFAAFCNFEDSQILSSSPERFVKVDNKQVETRPIKGTIHRSQDASEDQRLAQHLLQSEKDRAENIMIVDLMRNDLSKVCKPHSVKVPTLCGLESYKTVHHLVSVVQGELKQDCDAIDLLAASFPGGSITGAPKIRSMEIIDELEPFKRGPYCGSIGYIAFNGDMDLNIAIRTICIKNNQLTFGAGGAITADSNPEDEFQESLAKAQALLKSLTC